MSTPAALALLVLLLADPWSNAQAARVTAGRLDGSTISGDLRKWTESQVVIATPDGDQQIPFDQLMSLRWQGPAAAEKQTPEPPALAELTDGTLIPISSLRISASMAALTFAWPGDAKENNLRLPAQKLAAVRFQRLDPNLAGEWDKIRQLKLANDVLVVLQRDGKSLDYYEGGLGDITQENVEFKLDGELNRIDRSRVAGVIYFRTNRNPVVEPRVVLHGRSGLRAGAKQFEFENSLAGITTIGDTKLMWPIDDIEVADFSLGKVIYLSDIEPASQDWSPLVGLPTGVTLAAEYGRPRRDHSAFGEKLSLLVKKAHEDGSAAPGDQQSFNRGLALRSRTELVYRLPAGFKRFKALAGIDPATRAIGNVRLTIFADDRPLLETDVTGDQPPQPIDVEITGAKRLKILVDFGQNQDTGDWLNLCDAKILK